MTLLLAAALALSAATADTLPVPHSYQAALAAGTRSPSGAPGPAYWQQYLAYEIEASLDPDSALLTGSETIRYANHSPDTLDRVTLNLGQNVFAPGNPRNRFAPITGGMTLERLVVQGRDLTPAAPAGRSLPTVVQVTLPDSLAPGATAELEIAWRFVVPEHTFRMGRDGHEVFFLGQWYPQIAVYDDLRGWDRDPYMGDGEFYLEYGDFDVAVTVPEGWLVGASGVLLNPADVLTSEARARLDTARTARDVVHVVTVEDRDAGRATARGGSVGTLTWRYRAEHVRDFAWGTSNRYVWDATVARYPDDDGAERTSLIQTLYRPDRPNWDRSAAYARHAIESHSRWYPYPYPQMTVDEGVIGGGMEYPMVTIIGGGRTPLRLYGVISHELAHMWWPMVVGSDEKAYAWMDEGLASFSEDVFTPTLFPEEKAGLNSMNGYLRIAGSDRETPSMRHADLYGPFGNRGVASYGKPASVFRALRTILGHDVFDRALRTYIRRWAFKHPDALDLFHTFEDVSGRDLDDYFYAWMYTTRVMDQAVAGVSPDGDGTIVTIEDHGGIRMPVLLSARTADGRIHTLRRDVDAWRDRRMQIRVPGRVVAVTLDPDQLFPDVTRADNHWEAGG